METARWPLLLEPWLDPGLRQRAIPPPWAPECARVEKAAEPIKIVGLNDDESLCFAKGSKGISVELNVRGTHEEVYWIVNGRLLARQPAAARQVVEFSVPGRYVITAFNLRGEYDRVSVSVLPSS